MGATAVEDAGHRLQTRYEHGEVSATELRQLLADHVDDEESLADLIASDGRLRLERGLALDLNRYLDALPGLDSYPDALDAAIDVVLRFMYERDGAQDRALALLIEQYPALEPQIRESAALSNAIWSTSGLRTRLSMPPVRALPQEFGPVLSDGARRYLLTRLLGEGAFGQVYLAVDRQLSQDDHRALVAIKILTPPEHGPWTRQSLIEEAAKARRVDHPNVVRVLDRNTSDADEDYIVYEYVDGGDMSAWIRRQERPMPVRAAVTMMAMVARGVEAAHAAGLVHCDLKPGNIMVTGDGVPKVADFGVSVRFGDRQTHERDDVDEIDHPIGNVAFIAPEQFRMEPGALSVPADIYALGGMLYLLLTGELPNGSTLEQIRNTHEQPSEHRHAPSPRARRPEIGRDLDAICRRAMAIDTAARHRWAGELADDLESWLRHEPIRWANPSPVRLGVLWVRRRPVVAALTVVLTLALVTAAYGFVQARINRQRAEFESTFRRETTERILTKIGPDLNTLRAQANHAKAEMLATLWLIDNVLGADVLDMPEHAEDIRAQRIDYYRNQIQLAHAGGAHRHLTTLHWEFALAFWLLIEHQPQEAFDLLQDNAAKWRELLPDPDDPWFAELEALEVIALAQLALGGSAGAAENGPAAPGELLAQLIVHRDRHEQHNRRSPMHRLIMRTIVEIYGPQGLNDDDAAEQARAALHAIENE